MNPLISNCIDKLIYQIEKIEPNKEILLAE